MEIVNEGRGDSVAAETVPTERPRATPPPGGPNKSWDDDVGRVETVFFFLLLKGRSRKCMVHRR